MLEYRGMIESSVTLVKGAITEYLGPSERRGRNASDEEGRDLYTFFRLLAVCHTVVVDKDPKTNEIFYQASSPDELALI